MDKLHLRWPLAEAAYDIHTFAEFKHGCLLDAQNEFSPYIRIDSRYGYERLGDLDDPAELTADAGYVVTVQFNPARTATLANGGDGLCPFDLVQTLGRRGFDALQHRFPAACAWEDVLVVRIDLARDFSVDDPAAWLEQGRGTRHQYARKQPMYVGQGGEAQTLVSGVKGQRCQLYDRPAERKAKKKPCSEWTRLHNLRWEAQLTGKKTVSSGLGTLARLTPRHLEKALRKVWTESRVGEMRLTPSPAELIAASRLSAADKPTLLGYVTGREQGCPVDDGLPKEERTRLRGLAAEHGMVVRGNAVKVTANGLRLDLASSQPVQA